MSDQHLITIRPKPAPRAYAPTAPRTQVIPAARPEAPLPATVLRAQRRKARRADFLLKSLELAPKYLAFKLTKARLLPAVGPINLTLSVTNVCQSRCKTCDIWDIYNRHPEWRAAELTLEEIEKLFKSIGHVYFLNLSGGEPFLRKDLPEIVALACKHLSPAVIHCPTNALAPRPIAEKVRRIMEILEADGRGIPFTIKPSFDGVGAKHDHIRGVPGNFDRVLETVALLREVQKDHPGLHIGLGTVVSKLSIGSLEETADYAQKTLGADSYISEVAENRLELFSNEMDITPGWEQYARAIKRFQDKTRDEMKKRRLLARITMSFRLVYYDLVVRILREKRQVIPCYGGVSNVHISPYGDVWPCAILAYSQSMGNLRDAGFDFWKVWRGRKAKEVRRFIHEKRCACPLANQMYSNILLDPRSLARAAANLFR